MSTDLDALADSLDALADSRGALDELAEALGALDELAEALYGPLYERHGGTGAAVLSDAADEIRFLRHEVAFAGRCLRAIRKHNGISMENAAEAATVSVVRLGEIERGSRAYSERGSS